MTRELTPRSTTALVVGAAFALAFALAYALPGQLFAPPRGPLPPLIETLLRIKLFFTTLNLLMLVALMGVYGNLYRDLPNKYTRSLILLSLSLVLYGFTSNPLVQIVFGFHPRPDIGVFGFLPDIFVGVAIVVLLYQSQT